MLQKELVITTANEAVAHIAYKTNEVFPIYPITPATGMAELVEKWSSDQKQNVFGDVPSVFEMQSEAGVAGTMHGALQTGTLASTFTASQGLLLMMPNMYRIAGELTPNVIHVATRSLATQALSVFGDHSDVMAVRSTGYALLSSACAQEAADMALIAQAATLESRIPFVHFFDGFRTSHEVTGIVPISDEVIRKMMDENTINKHRDRALAPEKPFVRGTCQGPENYFEGREAINPFYTACPEIVKSTMNRFGKLTGRYYQPFDYVGHPEATEVLVAMGSAVETIESVINHLNTEGHKVGLIKVRLYRPFYETSFLEVLPDTCRSISVLDRTKEPGSSGEPLYIDIVHTIAKAVKTGKLISNPVVLGGRYGLSSKGFTPSMVLAIFKNMKSNAPKHPFTVGIQDDLTFSSLPAEPEILFDSYEAQAIFCEEKNGNIPPSYFHFLKTIGAKNNLFVQGYEECSYEKSNTFQKYHLRTSHHPVKAPYTIYQADFLGFGNIEMMNNSNLLIECAEGAQVVLCTHLTDEELIANLSNQALKILAEKKIELYKLNSQLEWNFDMLTPLQASFSFLKQYASENGITEFLHKNLTRVSFHTIADAWSVNDIIGKDYNPVTDTRQKPVSQYSPDGTFLRGTSEHQQMKPTGHLPIWNFDLCTQCGACSMACPQAALRIKLIDNEIIEEIPQGFQAVASQDEKWASQGKFFGLQINPDQCNSCLQCVDSCEEHALSVTTDSVDKNQRQRNWEFFKSLPEADRTTLDLSKVSHQQLQEPLFKYPAGEIGCGEAPYLKLLSQLYGDRMLVANATGASSIFGGIPNHIPWSENKEGNGPAWSNSLFEDNAEFGLGFALTTELKEKQAKRLLAAYKDQLHAELVEEVLNASQNNDNEIIAQRKRVAQLKNILRSKPISGHEKLEGTLDALIKKSIWIVGGDGWAYDIGFGGLDHVFASGKNVNILILDNEMYGNTGGQMSKATPMGAKVKFAEKGNAKTKKNLGLMAMTYSDVYVASVAIGADQEQTLKVFREAESYNGVSVILAYCHSNGHGIDIQSPSKYHKAAISAGFWTLYRRDPRLLEKGFNPFQLDSALPDKEVAFYLSMQNRFSEIFKQSDSEIRQGLQHIQKEINKEIDAYLNLANPRTSDVEVEDYHSIIIN